MCIVHNNGVFLIARFFYLLHFLIFFDSCSFYHIIFADYSKQLCRLFICYYSFRFRFSSHTFCWTRIIINQGAQIVGLRPRTAPPPFSPFKVYRSTYIRANCLLIRNPGNYIILLLLQGFNPLIGPASALAAYNITNYCNRYLKIYN